MDFFLATLVFDPDVLPLGFDLVLVLNPPPLTAIDEICSLDFDLDLDLDLGLTAVFDPDDLRKLSLEVDLRKKGEKELYLRKKKKKLI